LPIHRFSPLTANIKTRVREVQLAATLDTMLTIRQKREYLARIVRARESELADDSDIWQITITEDGVTRKLPDKLRAIALDNELSGEGAYGERLSTSDAFVAVAFCDKEPSKQLPVRFGSTGRIDPMRTGVNKAGLELPEPHWSRRRWYKPSGR